MLKQSLIAGLVALLVSISAAADGLSYTNLSIAYADRDLGEESYDGYQIAASFALNQNLFAFASNASLESKDQIVVANSAAQTIDADRTRLGLGYHTPLAETVDLLVSIAYLGVEQIINQQLEDVDGFELGLGVRLKASDKIELSGIFTQQSLDEANAGLFDFTARYFVKQAISIGAGYSFEVEDIGDNNQLAVDIRLDF